ncbi:hypothetical protein H9X57_13490 [Flavobacterium piscinae]|uniref:hypothetical protein n=1 Tax=Flavobacterium piscinae TaxID=2506424 RepID=UPI0019A660EA|nr:hypothetical protein [Flavobacterium piscinae]MBC8883983.1 hypothetical protein [Flavobacterium piscinae]
MKKIIISFWMFFATLAFSQEKKITPILLSSQQLIADEFITMDSFGYYYFIKGNVFTNKRKMNCYNIKIFLWEKLPMLIYKIH